MSRVCPPVGCENTLVCPRLEGTTIRVFRFLSSSLAPDSDVVSSVRGGDITGKRLIEAGKRARIAADEAFKADVPHMADFRVACAGTVAVDHDVGAGYANTKRLTSTALYHSLTLCTTRPGAAR